MEIYIKSIKPRDWQLTWRIVESLQLDFFERYDVLFVVFLFSNDDISVHENVVEQEELSGFGSLAAHLCEDAFADEDSAGDEQLFSGTAEAALHHLYSSRIRFTIY